MRNGTVSTPFESLPRLASPPRFPLCVFDGPLPSNGPSPRPRSEDRSWRGISVPPTRAPELAPSLWHPAPTVASAFAHRQGGRNERAPTGRCLHLQAHAGRHLIFAVALLKHHQVLLGPRQATVQQGELEELVAGVVLPSGPGLRARSMAQDGVLEARDTVGDDTVLHKPPPLGGEAMAAAQGRQTSVNVVTAVSRPGGGPRVLASALPIQAHGAAVVALHVVHTLAFLQPPPPPGFRMGSP